MKQKPNNSLELTLLYAGVFASFYGCFAVVRSFISVFLSERGFNYTEIGIITSIHMLFSALAQPAAAKFLDRFPKLTLKRFTQICAGISIGLTALLWNAPSRLIFYIPIYILISCFEIGLTSIMISIGMEYINAGIPVNMGISRSAGSLGYALISMLMGFLIENFGSIVTLPSNMILLTLLIFFAALLPSVSDCLAEKGTLTEEHEPTQNESPETKAQGPSSGFLRENPLFSLFLLSNIFIYFGHCIQNTYLPNIAAQFNVGSDVVGTLLAVCAGLELVPMVLYDRLSKRFSPFDLLIISAVGFSVKMLVTDLASDLPQLVIAQALQLIAYAMFSIPVMHFTNQTVQAKDRVLAQSLVMMMNEMGFTAGGLVGGMMLDNLGIQPLLNVALVVTLFGSALMIFSIANIKKVQQIRC